MTDPRRNDPDRRNPDEREADRRSGAPALSPLLIVLLILIAGGLVYVVSATTG